MEKDIITFEEKINNSFNKYSKGPLVGLFVLLSLVILLMNINHRYLKPLKAYNSVSTRFDILLERLDEVTNDFEQNPDFIESVTNSETINFKYTELYYSLIQEIGLDMDYIILDSDNNLIHKTRNIYDDSLYISSYNNAFASRVRSSDNIELSSINLGNVGDKPNALAIGKNISNDLGVIIVYIESKELNKFVEQVDVNHIVVTDKNGYVVASPNNFFTDKLKKFNAKNEKQVKIDSLLYHDLIKNNNNDQLTFHMLNAKQNIFKEYGIIISFMGIGFIIILNSTNTVGKQVGKEISTSINELTKSITKLKEGELGYQTIFEANDEMGYLINEFNNMSKELDYLVHRNEALIYLRNEAQIKQLEAQFNPHFMYNSLETIRYLINENPKQAKEMILNITYLLRYSLDSTKSEVQLKEDIEYVERYLSIIKTRLQDNFTYEMNVGENIKEQYVPRLLIQPLIENSVKHGLVNKENLHIAIYAFEYEDQLFFGVHDNGGGMSEETLNEILISLDQEVHNKNQYGIYNLYHRLKLIYGDKSEMRITSIDDATNIIIKIPKGDDNV